MFFRFFYDFFVISFASSTRCLATSAKLNEAPPKPKAVVSNQSFVANFFRGKAEGSQVFPYPYNLTEEESETLSMVLDPVERFFAVSLAAFEYINVKIWIFN